jgi:hypothetical protein
MAMTTRADCSHIVLFAELYILFLEDIFAIKSKRQNEQDMILTGNKLLTYSRPCTATSETGIDINFVDLAILCQLQLLTILHNK